MDSYRLHNRTMMIILFVGDALVFGLVTLYGFISHDTLGTAGMRILATIIPFMAAWFLVAPHLRAFDLSLIGDLRQLWRPVWAVWLAAPLAALLRGLWLDTVIIPVFVLVLGGFGSIGILIWRAIFSVLWYRKRLLHG